MVESSRRSCPVQLIQRAEFIIVLGLDEVAAEPVAALKFRIVNLWNERPAFYVKIA
jgi:hypothetical protein